MYNLGDPYTSFEWFGTSFIIFIMKNGAANRAAGRNNQKHHANTGPTAQGPHKAKSGPVDQAGVGRNTLQCRQLPTSI
jgi:hypothetical protein